MCFFLSPSDAYVLLLVLLFGTVLQDPCEFDIIEQSALDWRLPVHFVDILIGEAVPHCGEQLTEPVLVYHSTIIIIKAAKCVLDHVLRIGTLKPFSEKSEEHGEIDGPRGLVHHSLEVVIGRVFAQRGKHVMQVLLVDEPVAVLIYHIKGFFKLGDLILVEHGEDIGGCPLRPLLRRSTTGRSLAG